MLALLKVKIQPTGQYVLEEAGDGMTFNATIGPISNAGDFYRKVASRIAQLAHDGRHVRYIDHCEELTSQ
jgi:hypothetical protein